MTKTDVAIIIPAFNEGKTIHKVVESIPHKLPFEAMSVQTIVIDDGSSDNTEIQAQKGGALVLRHLINRGQGAALKTGFDYAVSQGYKVIVSFDADGQHSAKDINSLVQKLVQGNYDVVLGSRFLGKAPQNIPTVRFVVIKVGVVFTRILSRIKVTDTHNGFRAFKPKALQSLSLVQDRMEHASEIIDQIGRRHLKFTEVPVTISYTDYSLNKGQRNGNAFVIAGKMMLHKIIR